MEDQATPAVDGGPVEPPLEVAWPEEPEDETEERAKLLYLTAYTIRCNDVEGAKAKLRAALLISRPGGRVHARATALLQEMEAIDAGTLDSDGGDPAADAGR